MFWGFQYKTLSNDRGGVSRVRSEQQDGGINEESSRRMSRNSP